MWKRGKIFSIRPEGSYYAEDEAAEEDDSYEKQEVSIIYSYNYYGGYKFLFLRIVLPN